MYVVKKATDIKPNHRLFTSCSIATLQTDGIIMLGSCYACLALLIPVVVGYMVYSFHQINFQINMESMKPNQMCIYIQQLGHTCTAFNVHNSIMYNRKSHMLESCLTWITFWSDFWSHFYLLLFAGTFSSSLFLHFRVHYSLQLRCRVHFPTQRFHIFVYVLTDSCIFRHIFFTFFSHF